MKIPMDARIEALPGVRYMREGDAVRFMIEGYSSTILALVDEDNNLILTPEKSARHARLISAIQTDG